MISQTSFENRETLPNFDLPTALEAYEPPEARGLERDRVRLMVSHRDDDHIAHARFADLPDSLQAGDALVINTSGTMNAALPAEREDGTQLELRLSTRLPAELWTVEIRRPQGDTTVPFREASAGQEIHLPGSVSRDAVRVVFRPRARRGERRSWCRWCL